MNRIAVVLFFGLVFVLGCKSDSAKSESKPEMQEDKKVNFIAPNRERRDTVLYSLLGKPLLAQKVSDELKSKLDAREQAYLKDTTNLDKLIWYGRFLAYAGRYQEAIDLYSSGIEKYPNESRLYRHRGHRFITMRQFENAIADFEKAKVLMQGMPIQIEQDGMPNEKNIPVSSLQSNVLYHLGLAYYLTSDLYNAKKNFKACMDLNTNDDNLISSIYWAFMTARRGGELSAAKKFIDKVSPDMNIVENFVYHKICLHFKQSLSEYDLREFAKTQAQSSQTAVAYALANWELFQNKPEIAEPAFRKIVRGDDWNSFAYIAAEADLTRF